MPALYGIARRRRRDRICYDHASETAVLTPRHFAMGRLIARRSAAASPGAHSDAVFAIN